MKKRYSFNILLLLILLGLSSCISRKDIRYLQPSESLTINEEGLVPYNVPEYRVTKGDILTLNVVTTPKGDAAQFYSSLNTSSSGTGTQQSAGGAAGGQSGGAGGNGGNATFYFNGLKVDSNGEVNIFGIGYVKAEGRTVEDMTKEIQTRVNENFLQGKSEVRLNLDGIRYYILGDIETTGVTGEKTAYVTQLNIMQALAMNGGLNRTVDRKSITIHRKYPEGIKTAKLDLTREDAMNSPYYWLQNGDIIYLNTNGKSINGFGKEPLQVLTTGVSLITTVMSIYLILKTL
ncbi:polysaccharide biosynthesis/export family protein [Epilithonimonas ginsengisoli]|uniref:Polysaccharide biosynthesis/export family protein n=1 Tax=Epilithonimonas ginsengisoli TaxID=1245592 RepID=A0ABU4JH15_9FLAO|nr:MULTISPECIES: polysaccharide biosynthesis/export family protein [Chryseobacterium group]MBV6880403.1 polysaccharide biosynthesis/export family protein [Epilithonimonas sp. FP105]MDW8548963.1 polysaccharide biosynthesis/export family protein [Epilithonimonas ginsengisoli]OAH74806.1 gliding motility protein [Chryseobacterium sp. FP211-J200]